MDLADIAALHNPRFGMAVHRVSATSWFKADEDFGSGGPKRQPPSGGRPPRLVYRLRQSALSGDFDATAALGYPIERQTGNTQFMTTYKLVVFVPEADGEAVRMAMGEAGAGRIGNYDRCSFTSTGTGRFRPLDGARPAVGAVGQLEEITEERIETVCSEPRLKEVLAAIRRVHPYEEPAIDVYPLVVVD
jgi:hypothetical protein